MKFDYVAFAEEGDLVFDIESDKFYVKKKYSLDVVREVNDKEIANFIREDLKRRGNGDDEDDINEDEEIEIEDEEIEEVYWVEEMCGLWEEVRG